ncbi:hypothetical protein ABZ566_25985, partial [Streptomyces hygroscopicus]|uniref:hypothetical protein n=1 Tax=Streptomyces hygroscopicus TaxID=1912 RepID=UPI00340AFC81
EQEIRPPKQPKTIRLGNQRVPQASGPIIVINTRWYGPAALWATAPLADAEHGNSPIHPIEQ